MKKIKTILFSAAGTTIVSAAFLISQIKDNFNFPNINIDFDSWFTYSESTEREDQTQTVTTSGSYPVSLSDIPDYSGEPYAVVNDNIPFFSDEILSCTDPFEEYSELDELGRCGTAFANICTDLMPTESREDISSVTPSGWHNAQYDFIDNGGWVYNRCHLIGFQLAGENDNELNLITGARSLNIDGMLPFENEIAEYVKEYENHVLYRVTPIFEGDNLLCGGVLMEAYSVEDCGDGVEFCVFAYNVQDGVEIDYETGETRKAQ